jgi:hypothetical protein
MRTQHGCEMPLNSEFNLSKDSFGEEIFSVKGMLRDGERKLLYCIGKNEFRGEGVIIDAGAFAGASAFCFASGLANNKAGPFSRKCIHSYDLFRVDEPYVQDYIINNFQPIKRGDSFLSIFKQQTEKYEDVISIHEGDFVKQKCREELIEILFLDVCKSKVLNAHALVEFLPHLEPGRSMVLQQDFFHEFHPYIHYTLQYLKDYLVTEVSQIDATRVYRLARAVPPSVLERIAADDFSIEQKLGFLEELAAESPVAANLVEYLRLRLFALERRWTEFDREWASFKERRGSEQTRAGGRPSWAWQVAQRIFDNAATQRRSNT